MSSAYKLETGRTSPNRNVRSSRNIQYIVIHHWGSRGQKFANVVGWLCNSAARVSAHYVAEAGRVARLVPEKDTAWHAPGGNANGIGIECRPEATEGDYATVAALIRDIRSRHGNLPLRPHKSFVSTACPGVWDLAKLDRLARGASAPSGGTSAPAPSKPAVSGGKLTVDGRLGTATVKALQKRLGVAQDGRAGEDTWKALQRLLGTPADGAVSHQSYRATELGNGVVPRAWRFTGRGSKGSKMVVALQKRVGVTADGVWFEGTTKALQKALNGGKL